MERCRIYPNLYGSLLVWVALFTMFGKGWAQEATVQRSRPLMGTMVEITARGPDRSICSRAVEEAFQEVETIDALMSNFREDSELSRLNRRAGGSFQVFHPKLLEVLDAAFIFSRWSQGAFDVTVSPLVRLWGFYGEDRRVPSAKELRQALKLVDYRKLLLDREKGLARLREPGMSVDLGGIAKGYAVDKAVEALRRNGIRRGLVNAGGDLYALGRRTDETPWLIGLQHPQKKEETAVVLPVEDQAVATSGSYEKYFRIQGKKYTHIIDPYSGWPVQGMASVTVLADTAMKADALATAAFVLGSKGGLKLLDGLPGVEGILIAEEEGKDRKGILVPFLSEGLQGKLKIILP